jgi:hypothetical protein
LFRNPEASVQIAKWAAELSGYHITFEPRTAIKSQVLADFVVDWTRPITQPDPSAEKVWTIHCDGTWCHAGAGAVAVITSPTGVKHRYVARLSFALESDRCTNNIAGLQTVITEKPSQTGPVMRAAARACYNGPNSTWAFALDEATRRSDLVVGLRLVACWTRGRNRQSLCLRWCGEIGEGIERRVASSPSPQQI